MGKMKAWRQAGRRNTVEGKLTDRQIKAVVRANPQPSQLLMFMLANGGYHG